ncbi:MAG: hypothetical protein AAB587_02960, partial [Patescibacteria group bacterium]
MHQDLFIRGEKYISAKRAAEITGYTRDYIGQLCRGDKVDASLVGRVWFVSETSLFRHKNLYSQSTNFTRKEAVGHQEPIEPSLPSIAKPPESSAQDTSRFKPLSGLGSFLSSFFGAPLFEKMMAFLAVGIVSAGLFFYFNPEKTNVFAQAVGALSSQGVQAMSSQGARAYELFASSVGKISQDVSIPTQKFIEDTRVVLSDGFKSISNTLSDKKEEVAGALASFRNTVAQESFARMVIRPLPEVMVIRPLPEVIYESKTKNNSSDSSGGTKNVKALPSADESSSFSFNTISESLVSAGNSMSASFTSSAFSLKSFFAVAGEKIASFARQPIPAARSILSYVKKGIALNMKSVQKTLSSLEIVAKDGVLAFGDSVGTGIEAVLGSLSGTEERVVRNSPTSLASPLASVGGFLKETSIGVYYSINNFFCALFCSKVTPPSVFVVEDSAPSEKILPTAPPQLKKQTAVAPTSPTPQTPTVVERVVERVIVQSGVASTGGVSREELDQRLQELNNKLLSEIYTAAPRDNNNFQYFSPALPTPIQLLNKIDRIPDGTNIISPNITGGSWTDASSLSATVINASALSASTLTVSGNATFDSNVLVIDSVNNRVGIGTSSPSDTLSLNGPLYFAQISAPSVTTNRLYNVSGSVYFNGTQLGSGSSGGQDWQLTTNIFSQSALTPTTTQNILVNGTGTSTFAGGLEAWRQIAAPYFNATGTAATSTFAGGLVVDTNSLVVDYSTGNVGIGTTSPGQKLSVAGDILGNNIIGSYFTATTTTESTFPRFSFTLATGTSATTTNFFSTTASSTNLFTSNFSLGSLSGPLQAISGTVSASSTLSVFYGGTGANSLTGILKGNGSGAFTAVTGFTNYLARWTDANTLGTGILLDDGTNVGIATTSPWAKLSVGTHNLAIATPSFVIASSSTGLATTT